MPNDESTDTAGDQAKWLLFNDFLVKEVNADEALSCAPVWKVSSRGAVSVSRMQIDPRYLC